MLDMGFGNDKPQELPGMEIDAVTHVVALAVESEECDLKELMMTRVPKLRCRRSMERS